VPTPPASSPLLTPDEAFRERNDVHMTYWAQRLNVTVAHSNLLWGNSWPEAREFVDQVKQRRAAVAAALVGAVTLHQTCPAGSCRLMRDLHALLVSHRHRQPARAMLRCSIE
tara:strand:+ start:4119 stop:4454 length:336 start_codon:yes stop_codon:yes gene_type:complete